MPKRIVYEEIPENERPSFTNAADCRRWQQEQEERALRGPVRRMAAVVIAATQDAIVNGVQAARDATRKK